MIGLAIEAATDHVEILVRGSGGETLAHEIEDVGHGHTRRLTPLVERALDEARIRPTDLRWVAADLGPGSFTACALDWPLRKRWVSLRAPVSSAPRRWPRWRMPAAHGEP
jgi:hypothetical protein